MLPQGKKAKGSRLERKVAELYRKHGFDCKRMPLSGAIEYMKGDLIFRFHVPFKVEIKNQEKVKVWEWWQQARSQVSGIDEPVLFISGNHRPILAIVDAEYLMRLQAVEELNK